MHLDGLLDLVDRWERLPDLLGRLRRGESVGVAAAEGAKPYLVAALQRRLSTPILVVAARPGKARETQEQIALWSADPESVLLFEEPDSLPYERMPSDPTATAARLAAMSALGGGRDGETGRRGDGGNESRGDAEARSQSGGETHHSSPITHHLPPVVVASARAMMERLMSPEQLRGSTSHLRVGERLRLEATLKRWVEMGYGPEAVVETPGSFSRRGGILDVYPPGSPFPYRIELFGDDVESIRSFDPATQRSLEQLRDVVIAPPHELLPPSDEETRSQLRALDLAHCTPQARDSFARELDALLQGQAVSDIGFYRGFLANGTLLDYLPEGGLVVLDDPAQIAAVCDDLTDQAVHLQMQAVERGEIPPGLPHPLREWADLKAAMSGGRWARLDMRYDQDAEELPFAAPPSFGGKVRLVLDEVTGGGDLGSGDAGNEARGDAEARRRVDGETYHSSLITHHSPLINGRAVLLVSQQTERLADLLAERDHPVAPVDAIHDLPGPGLHLVHGALAHGWSSDELGAVVLSDAEIFGWTKVHRVTRRRSAPREAFLSDLAEGDLAVHIEHGIGRFMGLQRIPTEGGEREFMVLEYGGTDKLYVPVDQADRVARYVGSGEDAVSLSRLGTSEWERAKERVRKSVRNVARELLAVYSARQAQTGNAFSPDTPWQGELEASFPYVETPDQLDAIHQVKEDMEAPRPMDRLICGDVGYGKTEVALRAAFKAVMDGKQVAVLVPTTVLAQQHFSTFRERLQAFPVTVEVLSRFRSDKEQRQVIEALKAGTVDICIGTHRLVQKDVEFKDLGLVIVDEEQRFGVMHKERLKQLRQQVDVLTLSATPIPRTLHMSLAGIRDMSTMETAPEDRLPIRTFVAEYTDGLVREAILREMDRGGQVFFVHNRVQNIHFIAAQLQKLVPEARIAIGHGQMPEDALERVMLEFSAGDHDILVCTTIIESGLDIPNVNTIVVNNADRFGLAQLYQLRGRVGRGADRAYAYFLYGENKQLNETAEKRLKTIFENTELGSGFRIAMKDLEIRGAGNLLGVEQHGHVNAVGFDLYTRLLAEAVADLQGKRAPAVEPQVSVELPLVAHLPEDYVADEAARLSIYQRLATLKKEEDLGGLLEELQDRFGPLPVEAQNLFFALNLKIMAARIGVRSIGTQEGEIVVKLDAIPLTVRGDLQRRYGSKVKILANQVRMRLGASIDWMPLLQEVVEDLEEKAKAMLSRV
jgi:transcription-repair coupling factor (superfamily II helicase)